jgi:D-alanine transaminase
VYEVLPAYNGHIFRLDEHLARLGRSLAELRIPNPLSKEAWRQIAQRLIDDLANSTGAPNQLIYIQVTRGVAPRDHVMLPGLKPTVFVMCGEMKLASAAQRAQGVACVTASDFRWEKAHIKSTSLLGAVFARQISADAGALETVMFRGDFLSEAAASNVWVVKDGVVMGPPKDNLVLEGIRFNLIEDICREQGIPFELRRITRAEVLDADELMLSSATKEVLPVTLLDGAPVGHGASRGLPGPVYQRLYAGYQAAKAHPSI